MSSFLTLTGLCACLFFFLFFFLWHQYSSAQLFLIHIHFTNVISFRLANSSVFFLLLKLLNVDQKCIGWFNVTCYVCTVSSVMAVKDGKFTMCGHWKHIQLAGFVGYSKGEVIPLPFLCYTVTFLIIPTFSTTSGCLKSLLLQYTCRKDIILKHWPLPYSQVKLTFVLCFRCAWEKVCTVFIHQTVMFLKWSTFETDAAVGHKMCLKWLNTFSIKSN